jgi:hypothetical protein
LQSRKVQPTTLLLLLQLLPWHALASRCRVPSFVLVVLDLHNGTTFTGGAAAAARLAAAQPLLQPPLLLLLLLTDVPFCMSSCCPNNG